MAIWRWARFAVFVVLNVQRSEATDNRFLNSSSSTTTLVTTTRPASRSTIRAFSSTTNSLASITTCVPSLATIDLEYFLPESLRTAPLAQQNEYLQSIVFKYNGYIDQLGSLIASTRTDEAALSFANSIFREFKNDATALFGPAGEPIIIFNDIQEDPCLYKTCFDQYFSQSSSFATANPDEKFFYTASAPCCGRCQVAVDNVQIEYWPTPAPNPPTSTLVDESSNFTFISPSAYAHYTNLYASDRCGQVGKRFPLTRLAFAPAELTTSYLPLSLANDIADFAAVTFFGTWKQVNYADFDSPTCTCVTRCPINPVDNTTVTYTCNPRLSIHPKVSALDPLWATCRPDLYGFFDPPLALPRAVGLTAPKTTTVDSTPAGPRPTPTPVDPAPVNSPTPPIVRPTTTPAPQPEPVTTTPQASQANPTAPNTIPSPVVPNPVDPNPAQPEATAPGGGSPPNAPVTVIGTQTFVLGPAPSTIVVDGSSIVIPGTAISDQSAVPITINGEVLTPNSDSNFVIGTQTLTPGGPAITVSGTVISVAPGATGVVIVPPSGGDEDTGSVTLDPTVTSASTSTNPAEFTGGARPQAVPVHQLVFLVAASLLLVWM